MRQLLLLGQGSNGDCYHISNTDLAIKILCEPPTDRQKEHFLEERQLLSNIHHPHIIQLLDVQANDLAQSGRLFFIMEYCSGGNLSTHLKLHTMTVPEIQTLLHQLCKALVYLKSQSIAHRDVKPGNILLAPDLELVKLADFGLAVQLKPDEMYRGRSGTASYMAPEVVLEYPHDWQADVWSLGATLYRCMTGQKLFDGCCKWAIYEQVKKAKWEWPSICDQRLSHLVERMLVKSQFERIKVEDLQS